MDKIVFFHMNQLGDLLFSLSVLKAARQEELNVTLCSVVKLALVPLLTCTGPVDKIIPKSNHLMSKLKKRSLLK